MPRRAVLGTALGGAAAAALPGTAHAEQHKAHEQPVPADGDARTQDLGDATLAIDLPRGREVLIHPGSRPDLVVAPVAVSEPGPAWGLP